MIDQTLAASRDAEGSQVEFYLAAGRQPDLQPEASATVVRFAERVARQLERAGAVQPDKAAWGITALGDGEMLHRLAQVDTDHRARLNDGLRLLLAAAMLDDAEIDSLLDRYGTLASQDLDVAAPDALHAPA